jgi:enamine deaminase RidA (YjgF/YER057c/UK114 family)
VSANGTNERLAELGLELPEPATPGANYVPFVRTGDLVFVTGQLSQWNGERRFVGKLGREFDVEEGQQAARLCALNVIAQLRVAANDDLDRVVRCVRIAGYVNSTPEFHGQSQVVNGASDVFVEVFGERGATRSDGCRGCCAALRRFRRGRGGLRGSLIGAANR